MAQERNTLKGTLVIGADNIADANCISWNDVPDKLPSAFQYTTVLVVPGPDTEKRQDALRNVLLAELAHRPRSGTRVLWILNPHCITSIAADLGLGKLIPLRELTSGAVQSLVPGLEVGRDQLHFGIDELSVKALELAYWQRPDRRSQIAVAAGSADQRWLILPPSASYDWLANRRQLGPSPLVSAVAILVVLFALAALAFDRTRATLEEYDRSIGVLGAFWQVPIPDYSVALESTWNNPDAHMAVRMLSAHRQGLESIIDTLDPTLDPFELARQHSDEYNAYPSRYAALAVIAGDLPSAYRIATELQMQSWYREDVRHVLTQSLWQTAVEQLYELDLNAARERNQVYLEASAHLLQGARYQGELAPQRIRTLAYILEREFATGRIRSVCDDPDVVPESFARLNYGYWGDPVPTGELPGLALRRTDNRARSCDGDLPKEMIDYRMLQDLRSAESHTQAVCNAFPLECAFVKLRDELFRSEPTVVNRALAREVLAFAAECSYLSDDAVWMLFTAGLDQARVGNNVQYLFQREAVRFSELRPALACAERMRGDMNQMVANLLEESPCEVLSMEGEPQGARRRAPSIARPFMERCGL